MGFYTSPTCPQFKLETMYRASWCSGEDKSAFNSQEIM